MNYNNLHHKIKSNKNYITIVKSKSKYLSWNDLYQRKLYGIKYKII
jgi:hypothetical protein